MNEEFSRTLSLLRQERGVSQRTAAGALGISQALLSHYENGIREPGLPFVVRACDYYGVSADFLLGRTLTRDGTTIAPEELYDLSDEKDNSMRGSVLALLSKKLLVNSVGALFDLLAKTGSRDAIRAASNYLSTALYVVYRHLYQANPDNNPDFFSVSPQHFHAGLADADMKCSQAEQEDALAARLNEQGPLPAMSNDDLVKSCPTLYPSLLQVVHSAGERVAALLPRICTDREAPALFQELERLRAMGVTDALAGTLDSARRAAELGFTLRGDYGLGVFNGQTLKELKRLGFRSATLSFELKLAQIRDLSKAVPMELIAYGRLPLMITENCIVYNHVGQHVCGDGLRLVDRKGARFPVVKAWGCRNEILNAKTLFLADKAGDWQRLGLWAGRLMFTTENARECVQVLERYLGRGSYQPNDYTRGLYYRGVE